MKNGPYTSYQIRRVEFQRLVGIELNFNDLLPLFCLYETYRSFICLLKYPALERLIRKCSPSEYKKFLIAMIF